MAASLPEPAELLRQAISKPPRPSALQQGPSIWAALSCLRFPRARRYTTTMLRASFPLAVVIALFGFGRAEVHAQTAFDLLFSTPPEPVLTYGMVGRVASVQPEDILAIEISSSGTETGVLLRFDSSVAEDLAVWTELAIGFEMSVSVCAYRVLETTIEAVNDTGTLYIPGLTAQQAAAMRALWHGRQTCADLPPEVFPYGQ